MGEKRKKQQEAEREAMNHDEGAKSASKKKSKQVGSRRRNDGAAARRLCRHERLPGAGIRRTASSWRRCLDRGGRSPGRAGRAPGQRHGCGSKPLRSPGAHGPWVMTREGAGVCIFGRRMASWMLPRPRCPPMHQLCWPTFPAALAQPARVRIGLSRGAALGRPAPSQQRLRPLQPPAAAARTRAPCPRLTPLAPVP